MAGARWHTQGMRAWHRRKQAEQDGPRRWGQQGRGAGGRAPRCVLHPARCARALSRAKTVAAFPSSAALPIHLEEERRNGKACSAECSSRRELLPPWLGQLPSGRPSVP